MKQGQKTCYVDLRRTKSFSKNMAKKLLSAQIHPFFPIPHSAFICPLSKMVMNILLLTCDIFFDDMAKLLKKSMDLYNDVQSARNPLRSCHPFSLEQFFHKSSLSRSHLFLAPKNRQ